MARGDALSGDSILKKAYSSTVQALRVAEDNHIVTFHPWNASLLSTSTAAQWITTVNGAVGNTSKSTNYTTVGKTTCSYLGFNKLCDTVGEMEFNLKMGISSTSGGATLGLIWQAKNSTGSTWATISGILWDTESTKTWTSTAVAWGYVTPATGLNKPSINVRALCWNKTASDGRFRIKTTSYIKMRAVESR